MNNSHRSEPDVPVPRAINPWAPADPEDPNTIIFSDSEDEEEETTPIQHYQPEYASEVVIIIDMAMAKEALDNNPECAICLEEVHTRNPTVTSCYHIFCELCIKRWVENGRSCPLDRTPLTRCHLLKV